MKVRLNGESTEVAAGITVGELVDGFGRSRSGIAVAVSGDVVPRAEWDTRELAESDEIEVLTAAQGG